MTTMPTCPGPDALRHFSLGQVRESEAARVEAHLAGCPGCVATLHDLGGEDTLVDTMRASAALKERPAINDAVTQLMDLFKGWNPPGSSACLAGEESESAQDLVALLAPPEQPDELGRLGAYRILKVLGAGGMGIVFEAEHQQLHRKVALKAIRPQLAVSGKARKRFEREARAAAAINHDNVITIYEVSEDRGIPFLAMQELAGETLQTRLRREGPLPLAAILQIGRQLADGLSAAHAQGLLHRDVKPANVFLLRDKSPLTTHDSPLTIQDSPKVKLLDFGLAWAADESGPLTESGTVVGTPSYMAPEQARGESADVRSDLFSLGSVLYAMCTAQAPFQSVSTFATLEKVRTESPTPIAEINPAIPTWLADLIKKLHAKDRAERFSSAAEVGALLQEPAGKAGKFDRIKGHPWRWWAAAAALLLVPVLGLTLCEATGMMRLREIVASLREQPAVSQVVEIEKKPEVEPTPPVDVPPVKPVEPVPSEPAPTVYPAAVFPFEERGAGVRGHGSKVADLLFARLGAREDLHLVDRADLQKTLAELELNISGVVKPAEANKIGQLTGAKILISGSVVEVDKKIYLVAKILGVETSRVLAASIEGHRTDELAPLVEKLAEQIADTITKQAEKLVPRPTLKGERIATLNKSLKGKRPIVMVEISERHLGGGSFDPSAQTEIARFCGLTGFTLIDPTEGAKGKADILITGEAFSEVAVRNGRLVSVKARVELKAIDRQAGTILVADRQMALAVDLAEQSAARTALEEAVAILAERMLPKLVRE